VLGSQALELGPLNLPVWLIAAVAGYIVAVLVQRLFLKEHKPIFSLANDLLTTGVVVALLVWKLTPLATRFSAVIESPARLLYYPGGAVGLVAGSAVGIAVVVATFMARRRRGDEAAQSLRRLGIAATVTAGFVILPLAVVSLVPVDNQSVVPTVELEMLAPSGESSLVYDPADRRPTVLVFWATWCGPCTAQMPEIQRFYDEFGQTVRISAVNLTTTESGRDVITEYVSSNGLTVPILLDTADQLRRSLGVRATPTTVIIDASGMERNRRTGAVTAAWIERRVLPLL
jgi:thiol-disulfide isomerase/thioredoxin